MNHLNNRIMEKNIWGYVMNSEGEVIEKVADYIGVESFAKVIESLTMNVWRISMMQTN